MPSASSTHSRKNVAAVDQVDRQPAVLVFIGEVAPQRIVRLEVAQRLERKRLQSPRSEGRVIVGGIFDVHLQARAQPALMLVERRLEPTRPQPATCEPVRGESLHLGDDCAATSSAGAPKSSSGRVVPRPSDSVVPSSMTVPG